MKIIYKLYTIGTVKWFGLDKGYGFIKLSNGKRDSKKRKGRKSIGNIKSVWI